jgi:hypothetical protein
MPNDDGSPSDDASPSDDDEGSRPSSARTSMSTDADAHAWGEHAAG